MRTRRGLKAPLAAADFLNVMIRAWPEERCLSIMISAVPTSTAPQLTENIFLVLISKHVRICFGKANRMVQI